MPFSAEARHYMIITLPSDLAVKYSNAVSAAYAVYIIQQDNMI
jgi:hypothetical protein